jgi:hypothetical protein
VTEWHDRMAHAGEGSDERSSREEPMGDARVKERRKDNSIHDRNGTLPLVQSDAIQAGGRPGHWPPPGVALMLRAGGLKITHA